MDLITGFSHLVELARAATHNRTQDAEYLYNLFIERVPANVVPEKRTALLRIAASLKNNTADKEADLFRSLVGAAAVSPYKGSSGKGQLLS